MQSNIDKSIQKPYTHYGLVWALNGGVFVKETADDSYISLEDAAAYLNIKPGTLRKWIKQKEDLPAHQIGKLWKFKKSELDEWVRSGKSATN